jgi:hypothetical protein
VGSQANSGNTLNDISRNCALLIQVSLSLIKLH